MTRFLLAVLVSWASLAHSAGELPARVAAQLREAGIPPDAVGVVVQRLSDGAILVSHGAERSLQPASTIKLLTSLVALETLGPAYRGSSELRSDAEVVDGVLKGDLVLRGMGDVDLDWRAFEQMLHLLRMAGIREVRGDFVLDRAMFRPARTDVGLAPFDEAPEFRYNMVPDALLLNTNLLRLDLVSDDTHLAISAAPALEKVTVTSDLKLVERTCEHWEDGWVMPVVRQGSDGTIQIRLQGDFPRRCTAATAINMIERVAFADRLFRATWARLGGRFRGRTREGEAPPGSRLLAEHRSRPLSELVRDVNKRSDNPITRVIYLTLGALAEGDASMPTAQRADREVRAWFDRRGVSHEGLVLENGSGLSRTERIRPSQLATVLRAALASDWAPEFLASLPIVAVDGSMRTRLRDSIPAGRARIKTGTLRDTSAIAGYVRNEANEALLVVGIINHPLATRYVARPILDTLLEWAARSRGPAGSPP